MQSLCNINEGLLFLFKVEHDFLLEYHKPDFEDIFTTEHAEIVLKLYSTTVSKPNKNYLDSDDESNDVDSEFYLPAFFKFELNWIYVLFFCRIR